MFQFLRLFRLAMRLVRINGRNSRRQMFRQPVRPEQRANRIARRNKLRRNPWT